MYMEERMSRYVLHRFLQMMPIMVLISILVFALLTSMPGDPLDRMLEDNPDMTLEDYERLRALYCLDCPIHLRYVMWAGQVVQGNLGYSRQYKIPVQNLV